MMGPDAATLERLAASEKWVRRCNGYPKEGMRVSRDGLLVVLYASTDVHLDTEGRIAWRGAGPMSTTENGFTAEPAPADPDRLRQP